MTLTALPPTSAHARVLVDDLERQLAHWSAASRTFLDAEEFANPSAWRAIESDVGLPVRRMLGRIVEELVVQSRLTSEVVRGARSDTAMIPSAMDAVQRLRRSYVQVETTLEFFGDAVNSRTNPALAGVLRELDRLAADSMAPALRPAGLAVPPVLSYVDKGLGASILRAGIRLWTPGSVNPVAAIKVVRHNLFRPTSLFHEAGHQVAFLTGWVPALRSSLAAALNDDPQLTAMWTAWASEIAADVFAFVHTGYGSVSALYDVVGDARTMFRWPLGDPHPIGWLRTLLGCSLCRVSYGPGPWDALETAVLEAHPVGNAEASLVPALIRSATVMPRIAQACLTTRIPGIQSRPITAVLPPERVSPSTLGALEQRHGAQLWTSGALRAEEGIRIIALAGLREAEHPQSAPEWVQRARTWLTSAA